MTARRAVPQRGQALLEFAIAFPIFLIVVLAVMQFSAYWSVRVPLSNGARSGARYAATHPVSWDNRDPARLDSIQGQIQARSGNISLRNTASNIRIDYYDIGGPTRRLCARYNFAANDLVPRSARARCAVPDAVIEVTVTYRFTSLFPGFALPLSGTLKETATALEEQ